MATKENKKEVTQEVVLTPEQQSMKAHINSLSKKIKAHQFEIDELLPSLRTYEQALANSLQTNSDTNEEEKK